MVSTQNSLFLLVETAYPAVSTPALSQTRQKILAYSLLLEGLVQLEQETADIIFKILKKITLLDPCFSKSTPASLAPSNTRVPASRICPAITLPVSLFAGHFRPTFAARKQLLQPRRNPWRRLFYSVSSVKEILLHAAHYVTVNILLSCNFLTR